MAEQKICTKCSIAKPLAAFSVDRRKQDGLCVRCKACRSRHYQNNHAQAVEQARSYNEANGTHVKARNLAYYYANKADRSAKMAVWYEKNTEVVAANVLAWRNSKPGYSASQQANRRAAEILATPGWADLAKMRSIYAEAASLSRSTGIPHHADHIVPLRSKWVCGLHCEANLQILPGKENLSKSNRYWPDMGLLAA